jgi:hypothetical protein
MFSDEALPMKKHNIGQKWNPAEELALMTSKSCEVLRASADPVNKLSSHTMTELCSLTWLTSVEALDAMSGTFCAACAKMFCAGGAQSRMLQKVLTALATSRIFTQAVLRARNTLETMTSEPYGLQNSPTKRSDGFPTRIMEVIVLLTVLPTRILLNVLGRARGDLARLTTACVFLVGRRTELPGKREIAPLLSRIVLLTARLEGQPANWLVVAGAYGEDIHNDFQTSPKSDQDLWAKLFQVVVNKISLGQAEEHVSTENLCMGCLLDIVFVLLCYWKFATGPDDLNKLLSVLQDLCCHASERQKDVQRCTSYRAIEIVATVALMYSTRPRCEDISVDRAATTAVTLKSVYRVLLTVFHSLSWDDTAVLEHLYCILQTVVVFCPPLKVLGRDGFTNGCQVLKDLLSRVVHAFCGDTSPLDIKSQSTDNMTLLGCSIGAYLHWLRSCCGEDSSETAIQSVVNSHDVILSQALISRSLLSSQGDQPKGEALIQLEPPIGHFKGLEAEGCGGNAAKSLVFYTVQSLEYLQLVFWIVLDNHQSVDYGNLQLCRLIVSDVHKLLHVATNTDIVRGALATLTVYASCSELTATTLLEPITGEHRTLSVAQSLLAFLLPEVTDTVAAASSTEGASIFVSLINLMKGLFKWPSLRSTCRCILSAARKPMAFIDCCLNCQQEENSSGIDTIFVELCSLLQMLCYDEHARKRFENPADPPGSSGGSRGRMSSEIYTQITEDKTNVYLSTEACEVLVRQTERFFTASSVNDFATVEVNTDAVGVFLQTASFLCFENGVMALHLLSSGAVDMMINVLCVEVRSRCGVDPQTGTDASLTFYCCDFINALCSSAPLVPVETSGQTTSHPEHVDSGTVAVEYMVERHNVVSILLALIFPQQPLPQEANRRTAELRRLVVTVVNVLRALGRSSIKLPDESVRRLWGSPFDFLLATYKNSKSVLAGICSLLQIMAAAYSPSPSMEFDLSDLTRRLLDCIPLYTQRRQTSMLCRIIETLSLLCDGLEGDNVASSEGSLFTNISSRTSSNRYRGTGISLMATEVKYFLSQLEEQLLSASLVAVILRCISSICTMQPENRYRFISGGLVCHLQALMREYFPARVSRGDIENSDRRRCRLQWLHLMGIVILQPHDGGVVIARNDFCEMPARLCAYLKAHSGDMAFVRAGLTVLMKLLPLPGVKEPAAVREFIPLALILGAFNHLLLSSQRMGPVKTVRIKQSMDGGAQDDPLIQSDTCFRVSRLWLPLPLISLLLRAVKTVTGLLASGGHMQDNDEHVNVLAVNVGTFLRFYGTANDWSALTSPDLSSGATHAVVLQVSDEVSNDCDFELAVVPLKEAITEGAASFIQKSESRRAVIVRYCCEIQIQLHELLQQGSRKQPLLIAMDISSFISSEFVRLCHYQASVETESERKNNIYMMSPLVLDPQLRIFTSFCGSVTSRLQHSILYLSPEVEEPPASTGKKSLLDGELIVGCLLAMSRFSELGVDPETITSFVCKGMQTLTVMFAGSHSDAIRCRRMVTYNSEVVGNKDIDGIVPFSSPHRMKDQRKTMLFRIFRTIRRYTVNEEVAGAVAGFCRVLAVHYPEGQMFELLMASGVAELLATIVKLQLTSETPWSEDAAGGSYGVIMKAAGAVINLCHVNRPSAQRSLAQRSLTAAGLVPLFIAVSNKCISLTPLKVKHPVLLTHCLHIVRTLAVGSSSAIAQDQCFEKEDLGEIILTVLTTQCKRAFGHVRSDPGGKVTGTHNSDSGQLVSAVLHLMALMSKQLAWAKKLLGKMNGQTVQALHNLLRLYQAGDNPLASAAPKAKEHVVIAAQESYREMIIQKTLLIIGNIVTLLDSNRFQSRDSSSSLWPELWYCLGRHTESGLDGASAMLPAAASTLFAATAAIASLFRIDSNGLFLLDIDICSDLTISDINAAPGASKVSAKTVNAPINESRAIHRNWNASCKVVNKAKSAAVAAVPRLRPNFARGRSKEVLETAASALSQQREMAFVSALGSLCDANILEPLGFPFARYVDPEHSIGGEDLSPKDGVADRNSGLFEGTHDDTQDDILEENSRFLYNICTIVSGLCAVSRECAHTLGDLGMCELLAQWLENVLDYQDGCRAGILADGKSKCNRPKLDNLEAKNGPRSSLVVTAPQLEGDFNINLSQVGNETMQMPPATKLSSLINQSRNARIGTSTANHAATHILHAIASLLRNNFNVSNLDPVSCNLITLIVRSMQVFPSDLTLQYTGSLALGYAVMGTNEGVILAGSAGACEALLHAHKILSNPEGDQLNPLPLKYPNRPRYPHSHPQVPAASITPQVPTSTSTSTSALMKRGLQIVNWAINVLSTNKRNLALFRAADNTI